MQAHLDLGPQSRYSVGVVERDPQTCDSADLAVVAQAPGGSAGDDFRADGRTEGRIDALGADEPEIEILDESGLLRERVGDLAADVDALRVRLDDQGAMLRRTHQAVVGLAESVGKMVAHQRRRERGLNLNSFVAYTIFTLLLGGGFFMLYSARAGDLVAARDAALKGREEVRARVGLLETELTAREQAASAALAYYQLLREDRHAEAVARYPEIERQELTPTEAALFASGVEQARNQLVDAGYLAGLDAFRAGDLDKAGSELRTALAYEDNGPRAAQMRYYLGVTLFKQKDHEAAVRQLELAIAGRAEQHGALDVRYYLAAALEGMGEVEQARAEYERFAASQPKLPQAWTARRRAAQLSRRTVGTN